MTKLKNGQVSPFHARRARKAQSKNKKLIRIEDLNEVLEEICKVKGWKNSKRACKELGIPDNHKKATAKQIPGYISLAKQYLREARRLKVCEMNTLDGDLNGR